MLRVLPPTFKPICCKVVFCRAWNVQHRYSTRFVAMLQRKLHVFCCPFYRTYWSFAVAVALHTFFSYLSLQVLEYHILVLVRLFLKIHVISERLWKVQSGRFNERSSCWFDCYCNITVLFGLKAANGFWISLIFLPVSCYNISSFWVLGSIRALACVRTDVPLPRL